MVERPDVHELLRMVSSPDRRPGLDGKFGFDVSVVTGFVGETLVVDIDDYEVVDKGLGVYRLRDEHSHDKYRE